MILIATILTITLSIGWTNSRIAQGLQCIQKHEANWDDQGSPYYGGLQMNYDFELHYGPSFLQRWGNAGNWPRWAQIDAGVRGARDRGGFNPWPNSSIKCNLPYFF